MGPTTSSSQISLDTWSFQLSLSKLFVLIRRWRGALRLEAAAAAGDPSYLNFLSQSTGGKEVFDLRQRRWRTGGAPDLTTREALVVASTTRVSGELQIWWRNGKGSQIWAPTTTSSLLWHDLQWASPSPDSMTIERLAMVLSTRGGRELQIRRRSDNPKSEH